MTVTFFGWNLAAFACAATTVTCSRLLSRAADTFVYCFFTSFTVFPPY